MGEQACVVCGARGRPGRHSCVECGGAIVPVASSEHPLAMAQVPSTGQYGNDGWISSAPAPGSAGLAAGPPRRSKRPFVIATVMLVVTVVVAATIGIVAWRDYRNQPLPVPADLATYGKGQGRTYTTKWFIVRLPDKYRTRVVNMTNGERTVPIQIAAGVVGQTVLFAGSAPIPEGADSNLLQKELTSALARDMRVNSDVEAEIHPVSQEGGHGFDVVLHSASPPELAFRVLYVRDHVVVLGSVASSRAPGALGKIVESFHLV